MLITTGYEPGFRTGRLLINFFINYIKIPTYELK
jgi:hypothetical protein